MQDEVQRIMSQNSVKSNLEWLSSLSPTKAAVPTEDTKFLRTSDEIVTLVRISYETQCKLVQAELKKRTQTIPDQ